jgi:hypothetical protein
MFRLIKKLLGVSGIVLTLLISTAPSNPVSAQDILKNWETSELGRLGWALKWSEMCQLSGYWTKVFEAQKSLLAVLNREDRRTYLAGYEQHDGHMAGSLGCSEEKIDRYLNWADRMTKRYSDSPNKSGTRENYTNNDERRFGKYYQYDGARETLKGIGNTPEKILLQRKIIADPLKIKEIEANPYLKKYLSFSGDKAMYGAVPLGCNYRWFNRGFAGQKQAVAKAKAGCERKISDKNRDFNMQCSCRIIALDNTLLYPLDVYRSNTNLETDYMLSRIPQEELEADEKVCRKALNYYFPNKWSVNKGDKPFVKIAKARGYTTDDCNHILGVSVNRNLSTEHKRTNPAQKPPSNGNKAEEGGPAKADNAQPIAGRLRSLKKLEDAGLISKEEAAAKRKEILKNL